MVTFPTLSTTKRIERLQLPTGQLSMVLDTDTYNEVDDQFALAHALLSPDRLQVEAVYAAPFHNSRSSGPEDGMLKSYDEILNLLDKMTVSSDSLPVHKGSTRYLSGDQTPEQTAATDDLIQRAMARDDDDPLYVVAIGAITNIANALLLEPELVNKIVVVWLGGNALDWHTAREFNLQQDVPSGQVIFDSGVPLVLIPCRNITTHLQTTVIELEHYLRGKNDICDYLIDIVASYEGNPYGWSKVIWDVAATSYLLNEAWVPTQLVHTPILTDQITWSKDASRHLMRCASFVYRDPIFADLFKKLANHA